MWLKKFGIIFLIIFLSASPVRANSPTVSEVSEELICQCGCNMVLLNCDHAVCASREAMTTVIKQKIAEGQSKEQIIQFFVAQYGEQVLASPPKRGFNLTAWILPFVVILVGGIVIYITLKKWLKQGNRSEIAVTTEEGYEEYQYQLEEELKEFDERSFR